MKNPKKYIALFLIACFLFTPVIESMGSQAGKTTELWEDKAMGSEYEEFMSEYDNDIHQIQIMSVGEPTAFGIDVSHHQGTIDWDTVAGQIDFAIIRCGYGTNTTDFDDTKWKRNADACTRLGIPFGVYLYSYAQTDAHALSEAEHVLRLIEGYDLSLPIYYDLEDSSILENCSTADILRHAQIFCERIEEAGYKVGIYANYNWWTNYLTSSVYDQWDRWIARYNTTTGYSKDYTIWQYTSSGSINGISGNVDLNHYYGQFPPEAHEHVYTSEVTTKVSCTVDGVITYSCGCGHTYTESIPATGHKYSSVEKVPTCTEEGSITYLCSLCGDTYAEYITATGHSYESAVINPTCTESGYTKYTCENCGYTYQDNYVMSKGHNYVDGYCTGCGIENADIIHGDVNLDGYITSADAVLLSRYLVDMAELSTEQMLAADANDDGRVTSADAVYLSRILNEN